MVIAELISVLAKGFNLSLVSRDAINRVCTLVISESQLDFGQLTFLDLLAKFDIYLNTVPIKGLMTFSGEYQGFYQNRR
ncbi:hypothetical protein GXM_06362 [Nostoc sphaeroides CCNUC1]|uniref:Uncharacterized protein n=1 Tax=Nostoc sphaeroides CCNUC1 TaxID=2653204 RepID=A0A5P8W822_9NOSO|nr:hypothetical protein GXM_06362 [Nostoc sphaeroides CCNUC1]